MPTLISFGLRSCSSYMPLTEHRKHSTKHLRCPIRHHNDVRVSSSLEHRACRRGRHADCTLISDIIILGRIHRPIPLHHGLSASHQQDHRRARVAQEQDARNRRLGNPGIHKPLDFPHRPHTHRTIEFRARPTYLRAPQRLPRLRRRPKPRPRRSKPLLCAPQRRSPAMHPLRFTQAACAHHRHRVHDNAAALRYT